MSARIIRIEDLTYESFEQASIYVDACFLLAFLDENGGEDGELVERVLTKLQADKINKLLISNHVFSEVVQHLFIGHIYNIIYIAYRKFQLRERVSEKENEYLGNPFIAQKLMQLVDSQKLERIQSGKEVYIPVKETIKAYKERYIDRNELNYYYESVLKTFNDLLINLSELFEIEIAHVASDEKTFHLAEGFIKELQLEVKDALHLAVAKQHEADYFATLDGDFVHNFYTEDHLNGTAIFHISNRFI
ncbi:PIN domain-containing protein [Domibacillus robiginosus]|uniref:PIN domain-containing protein n=1 Tax=Domibacillus robiginosus TaxID=1071054 RepID=UPI000A7177F3|nr:PIN domain-containing protein [Domibacillus robiginosus]